MPRQDRPAPSLAEIRRDYFRALAAERRARIRLLEAMIAEKKTRTAWRKTRTSEDEILARIDAERQGSDRG